jgi:hypothetical protein
MAGWTKQKSNSPIGQSPATEGGRQGLLPGPMADGHGTFAYRPVPAGTTCQSLTGKPWPVKAQTPPPAKPAQ